MILMYCIYPPAQLPFRYLKPGKRNRKRASPLQAPAEPVSDGEYGTPPGDPESPHGKQSSDSDSDSDKSKASSVKSFVFLAEANCDVTSAASSGIQSYTNIDIMC